MSTMRFRPSLVSDRFRGRHLTTTLTHSAPAGLASIPALGATQAYSGDWAALAALQQQLQLEVLRTQPS